MSDLKDDIEKYLKGELTPAQMHALEKKSLNDPFLADALEGLQQLPSSAVMDDIADLRTRLVQRAADKKISPWKWAARIAAGLAIVGVATFIVFKIADTPVQKDLALQKPSETPSPKIEQQPGESLEESKETTGAVTEEEAGTEAIPLMKEKNPSAESSAAEGPVAKPQDKNEAKQTPPQALADSKPDQTAVMEAYTEREEVAENLSENEEINERDQKLSQPAKSERSATESMPAIAKRRTPSLDVSRKVIRGKVTFAEDGTGIPGVNVLLKDSNEGTVTDAQGNYELAVDEQTPMLQFSFIGFGTKEVEAESSEVNVSLEQDVSELSEVVVVGYSGANEASNLPAPPPVMELAAPAGGRRQFKRYLEQNMRYPEQALKNNVEGKVTIQFTVATTGQLTDFRVIRGLGYGCDEEVIRLIKSGPKWSPSKRNEESVTDRVRVRMRFTLPKK